MKQHRIWANAAGLTTVITILEENKVKYDIVQIGVDLYRVNAKMGILKTLMVRSQLKKEGMLEA